MFVDNGNGTATDAELEIASVEESDIPAKWSKLRTKLRNENWPAALAGVNDPAGYHVPSLVILKELRQFNLADLRAQKLEVDSSVQTIQAIAVVCRPSGELNS